MSRVRAFSRDESGVSMIVAVLLTAVLSVIALNLYNVVQGESSRSVDAVQRQAAYAAAEAGLDDYMAKLVDDQVFYEHDIAAGEASRRSTSGTTVTGSATAYVTWPYTSSWTYPNGNDVWRTLPNGYEYDLQITPPTTSSPYIQVLSTGRKTGSTIDTRIIQVYLRHSTVSDFERIVNGDVSWGTGATTSGPLYAAGGIGHAGTAGANIYSEKCIGTTVSNGVCSGTGPTLTNGAQEFTPSTNPSIRTMIASPLNFASFLTSLSDISRASQSGGTYYSTTNVSIVAWKIVFQSNGTYTVQSCTAGGGSDDTVYQPNCGTASTYTVPSNGAIYTDRDVIVSGTVNGRVTVASADDILIGGNIVYNDGHCGNSSITASDVLGLDATNNVIAPSWLAGDLTWCSAVIAENGTWKGVGSDPYHNRTLTFSGSATTQDGGSWAGMFTTRNYSYDTALVYLPAPWFPPIQNALTETLFRELPAP